jgi:hypothetical protein
MDGEICVNRTIPRLHSKKEKKTNEFSTFFSSIDLSLSLSSFFFSCLRQRRQQKKPLSFAMVLSALVRRSLLATAALGGAGAAALAYAGSHDDEPNPEVSREEGKEEKRESDERTNDVIELRIPPHPHFLRLFLLCLPSASLPFPSMNATSVMRFTPERRREEERSPFFSRTERFLLLGAPPRCPRFLLRPQPLLLQPLSSTSSFSPPPPTTSSGRPRRPRGQAPDARRRP